MADELVVKKENWIESTRQYLTDIRGEMKRVTWPNRQKVESTTLVVIVSVFAFALYFKVVDTVIDRPWWPRTTSWRTYNGRHGIHARRIMEIAEREPERI